MKDAELGLHKKDNGIFNYTIESLDDFIRAISFNSPLIKMGLLGVPAFFLGKKLAKPLTNLISPNLKNIKNLPKQGLQALKSWEELPEAEQRRTATVLGSLVSAGVILPTLVNNLNFDEPWWGLKEFSPKKGMEKEQSALDSPIGMHDIFNPPTIKVPQAIGAIQNSTNISPEIKPMAIDLLTTFPQSANIGNHDIVNKAITTGKDALVGGALGFVTAKALGLPNPLVTAGIFAGINSFLK